MRGPVCRKCGCTEDRACVTVDDLPCWWVEADLCSHCYYPTLRDATPRSLSRLPSEGGLMVRGAIVAVLGALAGVALYCAIHGGFNP